LVFDPEVDQFLEFKVDSKLRTISVISVIKAQKMLGKGCVGYLTHVVDSKVESKLKSEEIKVVWEY